MQSQDLTVKEKGLQVEIYKSNTYLDYLAMEGRGIIDLETTTISLTYFFYISGKYKVSLYTPFIYSGGGYLDPIIEGFHNSFSLPNGKREIWYTNRIYIWLQEKNILIKEPIYGLSNPSIFLSTEIISFNPYIIFTIGLKPGLISKTVISTSSWDIGSFLGINYIGESWFISQGIGITFLIGSDFYNKNFYREKDLIFNLETSFGFNMKKNFSLITGFYIQTSPYKTGIKRIDRISIINSYGIKIIISENNTLQFNIEEDSFTFAGTDITFHIFLEFKL